MTLPPRIEALARTVQAFQRPVLSVYVGIGGREEGARGLRVRVRNTLDKAGIDGDLRDEVVRAIDADGTVMRNLALFVEIDTRTIVLAPLSDAAAVEDPQTGLGLAKTGEPFLAPLYDQKIGQPTAVALYIDGDHWRLFRVSLVDAEELASGRRRLAPAEAGTQETSKQESIAWIADRGDASRDLRQASVDEAKRRHYAEAVEAFEAALADETGAHAVLMGPGDVPKRVEESLSPETGRKIRRTLGGLANPDAAIGEIKESLHDVLTDLQRENEEALIEQIKRRGVCGLAETLTAWQGGRIETALLPLDSDIEVWRNPATGYVATTPEGAAADRPKPSAEPPVRTELRDVVAALASQYDVDLAFATRHGVLRVREELEGIGGVLRW